MRKYSLEFTITLINSNIYINKLQNKLFYVIIQIMLNQLTLFFFFLQWLLIQARPVSSNSSELIKGKYFDRVVIIVFENQDYDVAAKDKYLSTLTSKYKGMALTNYLATTHPSQPNYVSWSILGMT